MGSCDKEENEKIQLNITNVELIDVGKIHYEFNFQSVLKENINDNNVYKCIIRTLDITKGDSIKSIDAYIKGDELTIYVNSYPNNFFDCFDESCNCFDETCFTVHDLSFYLYGLKQQKYKMTIYVNYRTSVLTYNF